MIPLFLRFSLVALVLSCSSCVMEAPYDGGPPPPSLDYGYYGYEPNYPWVVDGGVDIIGGYGHGGYGYGGYGGYSRGGGGYYGHGGGGRSSGVRGGGGRGGGGRP